MKFEYIYKGTMVYFDSFYDIYIIANTFKEQNIRNIFDNGDFARGYRICTRAQNNCPKKKFISLGSKKDGQYEHLGRIFV